MAEGSSRAWRGRLVELSLLAWGKIEDVGSYLETGEIAGRKPVAPSITPEVSRYMRAIDKAGRFVMPDEVDKILGEEHGPPTT
jgi:hypothetical protein